MDSLVIFSKLIMYMEEKGSLVENANQLLKIRKSDNDQASFVLSARVNCYSAYLFL